MKEKSRSVEARERERTGASEKMGDEMVRVEGEKPRNSPPHLFFCHTHYH